jgi:hypothetical protein
MTSSTVMIGPFDRARSEIRTAKYGVYMESKVVLLLSAVRVKAYPNDYSERLKTDMFRETIRILAESGVYQRWESTCYRLNPHPLANNVSRV